MFLFFDENSVRQQRKFLQCLKKSRHLEQEISYSKFLLEASRRKFIYVEVFQDWLDFGSHRSQVGSLIGRIRHLEKIPFSKNSEVSQTTKRRRLLRLKNVKMAPRKSKDSSRNAIFKNNQRFKNQIKSDL